MWVTTTLEGRAIFNQAALRPLSRSRRKEGCEMAVGLACRILVGKIDLDTVGATFFLGLTRENKVEVLRGQATAEDLNDAGTICIEVGGSGQTQLNNWDHHGPEAQGLPSATRQVYEWAWKGDLAPWRRDKIESSLVDYINRLDTQGPQALGKKAEGLFPTLSDVFAGMLLTERDSVRQLHLGAEMLQEVVRRGIDSFGRMPIEKIPGWATYAEAKAENNQQVAKAVEQAQWETTSSGLKLAYLETDFFGAPGALYGVGAQVVVAFSLHFGPAKVPKFTIAGNGIKVDAVLPKLNALESGWGGPPTGTIVGSPREGSKLTLKEVVGIVKTTL